MKYILAIALLASSTLALSDTYVQGHVRSDGTYVQPYSRSSPNNSTYDNYSTKGNTNPYTGQAGSQDPYSTKSYQPQQAKPYEGYKQYGR